MILDVFVRKLISHKIYLRINILYTTLAAFTMTGHRRKMVDKGGSAAGVARASADQYFISASATSPTATHPHLFLRLSFHTVPFSTLRLLPRFPRDLA